MAYFVVRFSRLFSWLPLLLLVALATAGSGSVLLYPNSVQAKPQEASPSVSDKADAASPVDSRLEYVEEVNIRIPGYRVLSGEYRIGADGTIALPGVGRLKVSKLTVAEFERYLRSEIHRVSNRETSVAVEVTQYRSVYVSGSVARAGAFPWKPGFSVLHAEALAGGIARATTARGSVDSLGASALTAGRERRVRSVRAAYDLAAALATIERLRIEKKGGSVYTSPEKISKLVGGKELERLAARQRALLNSRKIQFDTRVRALRNTKTMAASEKNALELQRVRLKEQLASRSASRERIKRMVEQGYSRADRIFEEQIRVAMLEERLTTTTLGISRMAMAEATAQQELEAFISGRHAEIDVELLDLEQRVAQLKIQLNNGRQPEPSSIQQNGTAAEPGTARQGPRYEVVRVISGKSVVMKADRTTALVPGDVLVVIAAEADNQ